LNRIGKRGNQKRLNEKETGMIGRRRSKRDLQKKPLQKWAASMGRKPTITPKEHSTRSLIKGRNTSLTVIDPFSNLKQVMGGAKPRYLEGRTHAGFILTPLKRGTELQPSLPAPKMRNLSLKQESNLDAHARVRLETNRSVKN